MMRAWIVSLALLVGGTAFAQPADKQPEQQSDLLQQRRDKIKQRIRALRAYTLTEQLELDEATAAKLFPALAKYDEEFDRLLAQRAELVGRLKDAGSGATPMKSDAIEKLIDEAVTNQKAIWDTETKRLEQLRKILTPTQVARTLIVLPQMERKIQNQLRRVVQKNREGGPGARRQPAGSGSAAPDDELGGNPFNKKGDEGDSLKDPFGVPRPPQKPARPPAKSTTCDPFSTARGCR
jgi:hypothetical protein